jgi:predicted TIM-barrel fold metal-dependent hydrolase
MGKQAYDTLQRMTRESIIDIHIHVQPWEELLPEAAERMAGGRADLDVVRAVMRDPERLLRLMDGAGVGRAGLINYVSPDVMGFTEKVNAFVTDYARHAPDRFIPFGSVHPRFARDPGGEVHRIADLGVRALKIHPPHQLLFPNAYRDGGDCPGLADIYEQAIARSLPVMIHTGTSIFPGARNKYADPMAIDDVAVDYPELTVIMAHGGRPLWMESCFFLLRRHPSVYMDISGIPPAKLPTYFPRLEEIAHKTLWGTDWPGPAVPDLGANLSAFQKLDLGSEAKADILSRNAARLFP